MISKEELVSLLESTETSRVERTVSTGNMDKFCEAICAFANDMPNSRKSGYLIIGAEDNGRISGLKVDDALLKKIFPMVNDYRNPIVAECMKHLKYVNKFNRGIQRVREMLQQNGNPEAVFDVSAITAFRVRVYEPIPGVYNDAELEEVKIKKLIIEFCKSPRTSHEIAAFVGIKVPILKRRFIRPMIGVQLEMTIPNKPTSKNQRYKTI
ncbi:MAG: RNA-binding domain-containing protein [Muribaculaceae bacterium]